jgi:hypothetical protein
MYLVVAGLSDENNIDTARLATICSDKKASVALRYAATLTSSKLYDNAFVYEVHRYGTCLLQASYAIKEKN